MSHYIFISILINKPKNKTKPMKNFIIIAVTALFLTSCATATQEELAVPTVDSTIVMIDTTAVDSISVPTPSVATTTVK